MTTELPTLEQIQQAAKIHLQDITGRILSLRDERERINAEIRDLVTEEREARRIVKALGVDE